MPPTSAVQWMSRIPTAIFSMSAVRPATGSWKTQMRTYRAEVHEAGEGDDPEVHGVDNVAPIELGEELGLDTWVSECRTKQRTDQKTIS